MYVPVPPDHCADDPVPSNVIGKSVLQTVLSGPALIGGEATKVMVTTSDTFEQPLSAVPVNFNVTLPVNTSAGLTLYDVARLEVVDKDPLPDTICQLIDDTFVDEPLIGTEVEVLHTCKLFPADIVATGLNFNVTLLLTCLHKPFPVDDKVNTTVPTVKSEIEGE